MYSHKINYHTLTDLEVVKLHDIYEIVYFINPKGIRVILENDDTNSLVNYIYQRFLKVKDWTTTSNYSYYSWIIYSWKQIPPHFPSFNSSSDPRIVILSRWVPRSITYKEYINYDHYIIMAPNKTKNNSTEDLIPSRISSHKEKLLMMPQSQELTTWLDCMV